MCSVAPTFVFRLDTATPINATVADAIQFQTALIGDPELGSYHTPMTCLGNASTAVSLPQQRLGNGQRDCVMPGCSPSGCEYVLLLPSPATYTLQVSVMQTVRLIVVTTALIDHATPRLLIARQVQVQLPGATRRVVDLTWTYYTCSASEFVVVSDDGSTTCVPCPVGAMCTSTGVSGRVESTVTGSSTSAAPFIVASPGYWASPSALNTDGLQFYECPNPAACLGGACRVMLCDIRLSRGHSDVIVVRSA